MGFLVLIILTGVVIAIVASSSSGNKTYSGYHGGYVRDYDEDDYEDYETSAARVLKECANQHGKAFLHL